MVRWVIVIALLMAGSVWPAVQETGTADGDTCSGSWNALPIAIVANAFITPDVAGLVADSGWLWFGDGAGDSAAFLIYANSTGNPAAKVATSDSVGAVSGVCAHLSVMFNQESIVQNDSIWLTIFAYAINVQWQGKRGDQTEDNRYEFNPSGADDPWDIPNQSTAANFALSFRLFTSDAAGNVHIIGKAKLGKSQW